MATHNHDLTSNRNFDFVPLPAQKPLRIDPQPAQGEKQFGHNRYWFDKDRFSGKLFLNLIAKTSVSVSSGIVEMGSDLAKESNDSQVINQFKSIQLVKSSIRKDGTLIIPGSSLKGTVRSMYEAITQSCICKTKANLVGSQVKYKECTDSSKLCPACLIFGAMGWQGLVHFVDAQYQSKGFQTRKIPSLFPPNSKAKDLATGKEVYFDDLKLIRGRKFYPHTYEGSAELKLQIQHAEAGQNFTTHLRYMNLTSAQLGVLFIVLGLEKKNPLVLKIGGGKGVGMGSVIVQATSITELKSDRYEAYKVSPEQLEGKDLDEFIRSKIKAALPQFPNQSTSSNLSLKPKPKLVNHLVQPDQLEKLKSILKPSPAIEIGVER